MNLSDWAVPSKSWNGFNAGLKPIECPEKPWDILSLTTTSHAKQTEPAPDVSASSHFNTASALVGSSFSQDKVGGPHAAHFGSPAPHLSRFHRLYPGEALSKVPQYSVTCCVKILARTDGNGGPIGVRSGLTGTRTISSFPLTSPLLYPKKSRNQLPHSSSGLAPNAIPGDSMIRRLTA